jgi:hypothetical protein
MALDTKRICSDVLHSSQFMLIYLFDVNVYAVTPTHRAHEDTYPAHEDTHPWGIDPELYKIISKVI